MNSDRYSPDDLTSDHDEDVAAEQQQPKSAPEKPNPAKPNRAKKKDTDKVTGATRRKKSPPKKSPPKKTSARVRRTDSDKMADKVTEKVTGKAGGKAKANAATTTKIGSVKGGPVRAEEKRPARRTATNRVGKTALSKDAVMRAMAKQELVANNIAERQALKLEQDQANSAALRKELKAKQSKTPAEIGGQGVIWSLLALGLAACGGGGTKFISGPTVNVPKLHDNKVSSAELAASEAARAKAEAARDKAAQELGETRNELETTKDNLGETTTDLEFTLNQLLGSAGVVRKGLPRNAKIYLLNENLERDGEHIAVTDVDGRFDISGLTLDQKRQLLKYGFEADLSEAYDSMTGERYDGGSLRSLATTDGLSAFASPLTTLLGGVGTTGERDALLNLMFPDREITLQDILSHLNYRMVAEDSAGAYDADANAIEAMAIRIMATLERFVSEDAGTGTSAEKSTRAVKKLVDAFQEVITHNAAQTTEPTEGEPTVAESPKKNVDDVAGLKSEAEVQHLIKEAEQFGGGRPSAAPLGLETAEDTAKTITLSDLGFSDAEEDEDLGAITFTGLDLLAGTLTFVAAKDFQYNGENFEEGETVTVFANQKIHIDWIKQEGANPILFTFTPGKDQSGDAVLTYRVEAKKKGADGNSDYDPANSADPGSNPSENQLSENVKMTITVTPVNDAPTDTSVSDAALLSQINAVLEAKRNLDSASAGGFATSHTALQHALDALIALDVGSRALNAESGAKTVGALIEATQGLLQAGIGAL